MQLLFLYFNDSVQFVDTGNLYIISADVVLEGVTAQVAANVEHQLLVNSTHL